MQTPLSTCIRLGWITLLALTGFGCATAPSAQPTGPHPQWPAAPAQPRIRHVQDITGASAMGKTNFFQSLGRLITGERPELLRQPSSVAAEGSLLVVSDQERQAVQVLDFASGRNHLITRIGEQYLTSPVGVAICGQDLAIADSMLKQVAFVSQEGKLRRTLAHAFQRPTGLAYDARTGELFVVDTLAHQVLTFNREGQLTRTLGTRGGDIGQFNFPTHVCVDTAGQLYVTDSLNFRVQVFDRTGQYLFEIGRHGDATGHLGVPKGVAVDGQGHVYIVDSYFCTVQIFDQDGQFLLNFGDPGDQWGQFQVPGGIAIDAQQRIYVCDAYNHRVQVFQYLGGPDHDAPKPGESSGQANR